MTDQLRGPDVSQLQGVVNWDGVKGSGASFAIAKATEGEGFEDAQFRRNWAEMKRVGLVRGCYGFARPDFPGNNATAEADWFCRVVNAAGGLEPGDIVALDMEVGNHTSGSYGGAVRDLGAYSLAWLQRVEATLGVRPMIYSYPWFIASQLGNPGLAAYPLWLAAYDGQCPARIGVWDEVALWQHSSTASVAGIAGDVDESLIARTIEGLRELGKGLPPVPAPVTRPIQPGTPGNGARYLVKVDMEARHSPSYFDLVRPIQMVYRGAVADATGRVETDARGQKWCQCVCGGRPVWLFAANLRPI